MIEILRTIWSNDEGQDIAEYALMLAVILVIVILSVQAIGSNAQNVFNKAANALK